MACLSQPRSWPNAYGSHPLCTECISSEVMGCLGRVTYFLMPIVPGGAYAIYDPSPSHSVLGCSGHSSPVGPLLFQLCFSVLPPTVARPASLPLPLSVPGQGLACDAGCWLPEGVSNPAPLPPQYLLGHWFLPRSLPQVFVSGHWPGLGQGNTMQMCEIHLWLIQ